jgi:hypothetical protein
MSKEFINYINGHKDKSIITRENLKKHKFKLTEGIMTFDVDLKLLNCVLCKNVNTCSLKKCIHIYKLFEIVYKVPFDKLQYLWSNNNYLKVLNGEDMEILSNDVECPICLDDAGLDSYRENKVIHCLVCGKFYHTNCLRKSNKGIVCLNCTNNWLPDWMNNK